MSFDAQAGEVASTVAQNGLGGVNIAQAGEGPVTRK